MPIDMRHYPAPKDRHRDLKCPNCGLSHFLTYRSRSQTFRCGHSGGCGYIFTRSGNDPVEVMTLSQIVAANKMMMKQGMGD